MRCSHPRKEQRMRARYSSMLAAAVALAASTGALFESVEPPTPPRRPSPPLSPTSEDLERLRAADAKRARRAAIRARGNHASS